MTDEQFVMSLLEEGNPAVRVPDFEETESGTSDDLDSIRRRREIMSQETKPMSRRPLVVGVSMAFVIGLIVLGVALLPNAEQTPVVATAPPSSVLTPPTSEVVDDWEDTEILLFAGEAGVYRTNPGFFAQFRVTLPDGWARTFPELVDVVELSPTPVECDVAREPASCAGLLTVISTGQTGVDDTVDFLSTRPGVDAGEAVDVEVAGVSGQVFEMSTQNISATLHPISDGGRFVIQPNREVQAYVLDVTGVPVTILVDGPPGSGFGEEALEIIETIEWRDLR